MTMEDDVEAFLETFERTAKWEGWPQGDWADVLAPLLTGAAQLAYHALELDEAHDYELMKVEILARCGQSPVNMAGDFYRWR